MPKSNSQILTGIWVATSILTTVALSETPIIIIKCKAPVDAIDFGSTESLLDVYSMVISGLFCIVFPTMGIYTRNLKFVCIITFVAILITATIYFNNVNSYFYVTSDEITIRSGLLESEHRLLWRQVTSIKSECQVSKNGFRSGQLSIGLQDGVGFQLVAITPAQLQTLKAALRDAHFQYDVLPTVTRVRCPDDLFPILTTW